MLARTLLVLIAVCAAVGADLSQATGQGADGLPEPCRTKSAEPLAALEKRKDALEKAIARAREKAGKDADNTKRLTKTQTDLLEVLFAIECAKARQELAKADAGSGGSPPPLKGEQQESATQALAKEAIPQAAPSPAPPSGPKAGKLHDKSRTLAKKVTATEGPSPDALDVTTYFATNRGRTGAKDPEKAYDASVSKLSYGRAVVSIPSTHKPGSLELPSIWKLEWRADARHHFILKDTVALDPGDARTEMIKRLKESKSRSLLVFVHGYNMSFAETAMRTAQLAYDLEFPGIPFFFSWPSAGQYTGYLRDAETAQLSQDAFNQALDDLAQLPVTNVYIIAHSMGSRLVTEALKTRVDKGKTTTKISDLLLAAPDINADLFRSVIAPRLKALVGTQTTVYASSADLALRASKAVHGYPRVGDTAGGVLVLPGLDTIDASKASLAVRAFGHSYLTDSAAVLKDIAAIVRQRLSVKQRGLAQLGSAPHIYWSLPERP